MINIEEEQNRRTKCLLVGEPGNNLAELKGLADTPILPDGLIKILTFIHTFCLALVVCLVQTDEQQAVAVL